MGIVTLSDSLILRQRTSAGRILRDRTVCGLCLKINKRTCTFFLATSISGKQFRRTLGRWPLLSVAEARVAALPILLDCRLGITPIKKANLLYPSLTAAIRSYCEIKKLKASSLERYQSIIRTHFGDWQNILVDKLDNPVFSNHCQKFSQTNGAAIVELGRGLIGSLFKFLNATYGLLLVSPFVKLAHAGLMQNRSKPRMRLLAESELPEWYRIVQQLPELQRDYLMLICFTGLRRNECSGLMPSQIDFDLGIFHVPLTKTGSPHSLPITPVLRDILIRRVKGIKSADRIFSGLSVDHVAEMAIRAGAPKFMLHDLRKLLVTLGEKLGLSDAVNRRILNHAAKRGDTMHRHYITLNVEDIREPLVLIQNRLATLMMNKLSL